ncbi:VOC family protein [Streptomyces erythrochromogenes]|uniref:VOC family protein n=1 Tax=Streptomyces erythrochromogenes TaxID=285574 RepID=UPI0034348509
MAGSGAPPSLRLTAINFDCADPEALAAFYQRATGLDPHPASDDEFAGLVGEDGLFIGFQRVDGHKAPSWPGGDVPQQAHLDFDVDDLDEAEALLLELGASKPGFQPGGDRWRVFLDPAGHPFCLSPARRPDGQDVP